LRRDADGRWRFLDFGFFTVEVDGALHLLPRRYWDDMRRQNALTLRGEHILRFPSVAIRIDPGSVVQQLREAREVWG
jgi:very-short-patch-repair endonuclease